MKILRCCCCSRIFASILILLSLFGVENVGAKQKSLAFQPPYLSSCSMGNLYAATRTEKNNRYAYGLTLDCTFFFFEISQYHIIDRALDFLESLYVNGQLEKNHLCPTDMFIVQYVSQNYTPYFEVLEVEIGSPHYIPISNQSIFFTHITPRTITMTLENWKFSPSGWVGHYRNLLIHAKPRLNSDTGRNETKTYIRAKHEEHPGACIRQSLSDKHLFQIYPILGDDAEDLQDYFKEGKGVGPKEADTTYTVYYFFAILGVLAVAGISILLGFILSIWKIAKYFMNERKRHEIEKFVVACYVEKLELISKGPPKAVNEPKKKKKKKSKRRYSPSESQSSYRRHRRHHRKRRSESETISKMPHGSKLIPIPNEKDLFATDKKKVELKPAAVQEPRKSKATRRDPSKGGVSASVCSLKSITQSVSGSQDWTGKGVRVSQRKTALQQYKDDQQKDEDEAYKLGMNLSTFKRKKKRQQHGIHHDSAKESKKEQYPLSVASGMSSVSKPSSVASGMSSIAKPAPPSQPAATAPTPPSAPPAKAAVTATPAPAAPTNSNIAVPVPQTTTVPQDKERFKRAEKDLQDRYEAEQRKRQEEAAKNVPPGAAAANGGGAGARPANNNPYGSLSVPPDGLASKK